ncbi:MAG TPA: sugar phosphate isomerase/epimerase family protein [Polyangiaceae bacterium]|nr:sugar phosphate isomerase/epimerase family protein [Polyangiaceae bacterium]
MREHRIGVMQGRLSPRPSDRLQAFPHASWPEEFALAKRIGFDFIEWIYEAPRAAENPIATRAGRAAIRSCVHQSGLPVGSVCGDYFMIERLAGGSASERLRNSEALIALVGWTREIGGSRILLPLLETSAVDSPELGAQVVESLQRVLPALEECHVTLGLEMEIPGPEYAALIQSVGHPRVRAYYDVGNSTAQGFDIAEDVRPLLPLLEAVHVKDRVRHGTSRRFGEGAANFSGFFARLAAAGYGGDFLVQHYFDADPEDSARHSLGFVLASLLAARRAA